MMTVAIVLVMSSLAMSACGLPRYFSATISGYVRDEQANANGEQPGINGAEIRVYLEDPTIAGSKVEALARTATMTSGGNDGYWSRKIIWSVWLPTFWDEGDSSTVWVEVLRKGYFPKIQKVPGILSDSNNVIPMIEIRAIKAGELKGRVVNEHGAGVNDIRVELDLDLTADIDADYVTRTATVDGIVGVFSFSSIAWEDPDSIPTVDRAIVGNKATTTARLYIVDADYYSVEHSRAAFTIPEAITLESGRKTDISATPLEVRNARFTIPLLRGRVFDVIPAGGPYVGVNGITVAVDLPRTIASPDARVTTATWNGEDGWFQFEDLVWTNSTPSDMTAGIDATTALVYIDDGNRYSARDAANPVSLTITSGQIAMISALSPTNLPVISAGDARFSANLIGTVQYTGTATGVNGVRVRLEIAGTNTVLTATTSTVSSSDGIYEFKNVRWTDTRPESDADGIAKGIDTQQVRVYVQDNDHSSTSAADRPVIIELTDGATSDSRNAPLEVKRRNFNSPKIEGYVKNESGTGLPGLAVVLEHVDGSGNTRTTTTDTDGKYVFDNVAWSDDEATSAKADDTTIEISLDDAAFRTMTALPIQTIQSDTAAGGADWIITAERIERWTYQTSLTIRCVTPTGADATETAMAGVLVTVRPSDSRGGDLRMTPALFEDYTNNDGSYQMNIAWSREPQYVPADDASKTRNGDKLIVDIAFKDTAGYSFATIAGFEVLSWSDRNSAKATGVRP
jgi:hypothetical protein